MNYAIKTKISGMSIDGFLTIKDSDANNLCVEDFTIENSVEKMWLPGYGYNKSISNLDGSGAPCYSDSLLKDWDSFNKKHGGKLVSYKSRMKQGVNDVMLKGWWLPAAKSPKTAPRIVVQHGFKSNSNEHRQMLAAYMLRDLGFNVLVNNFRDHCYSKGDTGMYEWGHAYPYDLLGAWDYAVKDPENEIGGAMDVSKVGLMGFSKGAFTTGNAFGLEERVPAAWVDGPPFTPKAVFAKGFQDTMGNLNVGFLASWFLDGVWSNVEQAAVGKGIDLNDNLPKKVLPKGPAAKRPLMWVHNTQDGTVPYAEGEKLKALIETMPTKYAFSEMIFDDLCVTKKSTHKLDHCQDHLKHPKKYKTRLCSFWKSAFGLDTSSCAKDEEAKVAKAALVEGDQKMV